MIFGFVAGLVASTGSADEPKIRSSVALSHYGGFHSLTEPFSVVAMSASYGTADRSWSVSQSVNKYYFVDVNQTEIEATDAAIGHSVAITDKPFDIALRTGVSATVPMSKYSRDNGVRTGLRLAIGGNKDIADGWNLDVNGFFRYQVNQYKTSQAGPSGFGGNPLPWYSYGYTATGTWTFFPRWSFAVAGGVSEVWYERPTFDPTDEANLPDHPYNVDVSVTRNPEPNVSITAGFSQGSRFEQGGRLEFVLLDVYSNYWFLASSYAF